MFDPSKMDPYLKQATQWAERIARYATKHSKGDKDAPVTVTLGLAQALVASACAAGCPPQALIGMLAYYVNHSDYDVEMRPVAISGQEGNANPVGFVPPTKH